jgi:hypothetical protein
MPRPADIQLTAPGSIRCTDAGRVAVDDRALEQVGERRQADVRMRADVVVHAGRHVERPEVSKKTSGPTARRSA